MSSRPPTESVMPGAPSAVSGRPRPTISLIIPTRNRQNDLIETVQAVLAQSRPPDELIIVDQSMSDASRAVVTAMLQNITVSPRLVYIWARAITGLPMARNAGFAASRGDLICYLDDDITPAADYLQMVEAGFECFPDWAGLCGRFSEHGHPGIARRIFRRVFRVGLFRDEREILTRVNRPRPMRLLCGGAACFRREVLCQFSFDEALLGYALGEDMEFCIRAGRRFKFGAYPDAVWRHRRSMVGRLEPMEMRRMARQSAAYIWRTHRRHIGHDAAYLWLRIGFGLERALKPYSTQRTNDRAGIPYTYDLPPNTAAVSTKKV